MAIKNIQKALTARILKRLDDGQPLVEVARKMKAIEGMQPQINDMERRLGIMQSVEPVLENAIKTLQKVVDVRGMGKKRGEDEDDLNIDKNIQKALTARILKRLDDGQPLVEVARKMKAIEGMQPQINDMERRLGIMQSVEPVLENAIKTLQKVVDVRGMGRSVLPSQALINQALVAVCGCGAAADALYELGIVGEARGDGDAAVAKTAAIKNIQKSLTARILKTLPEESAGECNVHYEINFNNGVSASSTSSRFATGMNGDEDLGQDITMKGEKFHYRNIPQCTSLGCTTYKHVANPNGEVFQVGYSVPNFGVDQDILDTQSNFRRDAGQKFKLAPVSSRAPTGNDDKLHFFNFDNAKMLYKGDWAAYKKSRPHDNDCSIAESDNWKGAQQCVESWECRGARLCERGGWCSGFDGCEGSPLPTQAPGVSYTH